MAFPDSLPSESIDKLLELKVKIARHKNNSISMHKQQCENVILKGMPLTKKKKKTSKVPRN